MERPRMKRLPLESDEMRGELQDFREAVKTCYGPNGRVLALQAVQGGHATVTSGSQKIFQLWKTSNPVLKLLLMPLQEFSARYHNSGLFAALLSTNLILKGLELGVPRSKVSMVTSYALTTVAEYLRGEECACKQELDVSSVGQMMALVRSALRTRPICGLRSIELDHLASLLLQAFIHLVPSPGEGHMFSTKDQFHIHTAVGKPTTSSRLMRGLLIECSEPEKRFAVRRNSRGMIVTALFDISMAGEPLEEFPRGLRIDTAGISGSLRVEAVVLQQMLEMADSLVHRGVGLVACQKCIHSDVKDYLRNQGVVVVDRVSGFHVGAMRNITGGEVISSFSLDYPAHWMGEVRDIRPLTVEGRSFFILEGASPHSSLILCCYSEVVEDELRPLCTGIVSLLEWSLYQPHVLYGGGCMETVLAHYLEDKGSEVTDETLVELQCDQRSYTQVMQMVASSFAAVASSLEHYGGLLLIDSLYHHCWSFPPHDALESIHATYKCAGVEGEPSELTMLANRTCSCGTVSLSEIQGSCREWRCVRKSDLVPDILRDLLKTTCGAQVKNPGTPGDMITCMKNTEVESRVELQSLSVSPDEGRAVTHPGDQEASVMSASLPAPWEEGRKEKGATLKKLQPVVCDPYHAKLKAIELVNDLASTVLRVAYTLSER